MTDSGASDDQRSLVVDAAAATTVSAAPSGTPDRLARARAAITAGARSVADDCDVAQRQGSVVGDAAASSYPARVRSSATSATGTATQVRVPGRAVLPPRPWPPVTVRRRRVTVAELPTLRTRSSPFASMMVGGLTRAADRKGGLPRDV